MSESFDLSTRENVTFRVWYILKFSMVVQGMGLLLLSFAFVPEYGFIKGLYYSLFHSVSAFTNGGLDLFTNSLVDFQTNPYILLVMMLLVITGGLGFIVWGELLDFPKKRTLSIYTKVVLTTTLALFAVGTFL